MNINEGPSIISREDEIRQSENESVTDQPISTAAFVRGFWDLASMSRSLHRTIRRCYVRPLEFFTKGRPERIYVPRCLFLHLYLRRKGKEAMRLLYMTRDTPKVQIRRDIETYTVLTLQSFLIFHEFIFSLQYEMLKIT